MGAAPDVEPSGEASLGPSDLQGVSFAVTFMHVWGRGWLRAYSIEEGAENVEKALQQDPVQTHSSLECFVAVDDRSVADRNHAGDAQADEHRRSVDPPCRLPEPVDPRDDTAAKAQDEDLRIVRISRPIICGG